MKDSPPTIVWYKAVWAWAVWITPSITDPAQRYKSSLLASIFVPVTIFIAFQIYAAHAIFNFDNVFPLSYFIQLFFIVAIIANRYGYYQLAIYIYLVDTTAGTLAVALLIDGIELSHIWPIWIVHLILVAMLLDRRDVLFFSLLSVAGIILPVTLDPNSSVTTFGLFNAVSWTLLATFAIVGWIHVRNREENQRAEIAAENDIRFQTLYRRTPVMMHSIDDRGRLLSVNDTWLSMMGYTEDEVLGTESINYLTPESRRFAIDVALPRMKATGGAKDVAYQMVKKEGGIIDVLFSSFAEYDAEGDFLRSLSVAIDVTAHNQTLRALAANEARFRSLYRNTPVMMHSVDGNVNLVSVSDHWLLVLGYEEDEVIGTPFVSYLDDTSRAYASEVSIPRFFETGRSHEVPYKFLKKDGTTIDVLLSAIAEYDASGAFSRSLTVMVDVTERNRVFDALENREQRLAKLHKLDQGIVQAQTVEEMATLALDTLTELVQGDLVGVTLYYPEQAQFEVITHPTTFNTAVPLRATYPMFQQFLIRPHLEKEPIYATDDISKIEPLTEPILTYAEEGIRSVYLAALRAEGKLIGHIGLGLLEGKQFAPTVREQLLELAAPLGAGFARVQLLEQTRFQTMRLAALHALDATILASGSLQRMAEVVIEQYIEHHVADGVRVGLIDLAAGEVTPVAWWRYGEHLDVSNIVLPISIYGFLSEMGAGHTIQLNDLNVEEALSQGLTRLKQDGIRSYLCVPLLDEGELIGAINAISKQANAFGPADQAMMEELAATLSIGIVQNRLTAANKHQSIRLQMLHEIESSILAARSIEEIARAAVTHIWNHVTADFVSILAIDEVTGVARRLAVHSNYDSFLKGVEEYRLENMALIERGRKGEIVYVPDLGASAVDPTSRSRLQSEGVSSVLVVPLISEGVMIGQIGVTSRKPACFSEQDIELVSEAAVSLTLGFAQQRLHLTLKEQSSRLQVLNEVDRAILRSRTPQEVAEVAAEHLHRHIPSDYLSVIMVDFEAGIAERLYAASSIYDISRDDRRIALDKFPYLLSATGLELFMVDEREENVDSASALERLRQVGIDSFLLAPLLMDGATLGCILLARREQEAFSESEVSLVRELTGPLAIAFAQARLNLVVQQQSERRRGLLAVNRAILGASSIHELADTAAKQIFQEIESDFVSVLWFDKRVGTAERLSLITSKPTALESRVRIPISRLVLLNALEGGSIHVIEDIERAGLTGAIFATLQAEGYGSIMLVPLMSQGQVIGEIAVARASAGSFSDAHQHLAEEMAASVAVAFLQAQLVGDLQEQTGRLKAMRAVELAILEAQSPQQTATLAIQHLRSQVRCDRVNVTLIEHDTGSAEILVSYIDDELVDETSLNVRYEGEIFSWYKAGKAIVEADLLEPVSNSHHIPWLLGNGYRTYIAVPLLVEGRLIGRIAVAAREAGVYSTVDVEIIEEVAGSLAIALAQASLVEALQQSEYDLQSLNSELEQRVEQRTAELRRANDEMESFTYSVSHDLRAPLRHIDGFIRLLERRAGQDIPEVANHYLNNIGEASRRMGYLIDDLLKLSRTGRLPLHHQQIDMQRLIREIFAEVMREESEREVELDIQELSPSFGDPNLLRIAWRNLVENALKYTRPRDPARIVVRSFESELVPAGFCGYCIEDNGVGFDPEYVHKMFGVFQRLHHHTDFEGTGIGLATVQRVVHRHGGTVWASGTLDEGAQIYMTLPVMKREKGLV